MTADTSDGGETKSVSVHIFFPAGDLTDGPGGAKETCQPVGRAGTQTNDVTASVCSHTDLFKSRQRGVTPPPPSQGALRPGCTSV